MTTPVSNNPEKAKRAAADPRRPGQACGAAPGSWVPIVARGRCEAKGDCVDVCPYGVFEIRRMDDEDFRRLGLVAKLKVWAHGMKTSYTPKQDACQACGLCVVACPEDAIELRAVAPL